MAKKKKDFEEEPVVFEYEEEEPTEEGLQEIEAEEVEVVEVLEKEPEVVLTQAKTFFAFTYECRHGGVQHCPKCYEQAKYGV
jgi:hypothetical protein